MLHDEQILTIEEAAAACPVVAGKRPSASTIWRWIRRGVRGVQLESRHLGGRILTSVEAIERFSVALAEQPLPEANSPPKPHRTRSRKRREAEIRAAEAKLQQAGVI